MSRIARSFAALFLVLAPVPLAGAAVIPIVVNSKKDLPDADILDGKCDADLTKPGDQITLRAAIMHANATPGGDVIELPKGKFKLKRKLALADTASDGDLNILDNLVIMGQGAKKTIIDGKKAKDRVFHVAGSILTLQDVTVRNGRAGEEREGGGILVDDKSEASVFRCTFSGCKSGDDGGGMKVSTQASVTVEDSTFSRNKCAGDGGGCQVSGMASVTFARCTFVKNKAAFTGGGANVSNAESNFTNCTFSANEAAQGGALAFDGGSSNLIEACTLAKNVAPQGSGIFENVLMADAPDTIVVGDTIVANDKLSNYSGDGLTTDGGNIDTGTTCLFVSLSDQSTTEPQLLKLKNNGGFTQTHALKETSPAIDRGIDAHAPASDQRGLGRVDIPGKGLTTADVGAFELQP